MKPFGRHISEEPGFTKQPRLRKDMIDDMNDFHGFITPGGKMSSQRLEDECSTALPSMCTTGSLESLPTTPAGWGTSMPPPEPASVRGWQPGAEIWGLGDFGVPPARFGSLDSSSDWHLREVPSDLDTADLTSFSFLDTPVDFPDVQWPRPVPELSQSPSAMETSLVEPATPPLTPRKERTADRTCPLAPRNVQEVPMLLKALSTRKMNLVKNALESDPHSASSPFWDQDAEPPLCAAIRLECGVEIVDLLLNSGADVKSTNIDSQNPLDVLYAAPCLTLVSANEIEGLLLRAGAEPSENSVKLPRDEVVMSTDMLRWDAFSDAHTLNDFGLPPRLGSFDLFDIEPPPPVRGMA